MQGDPLVTIHQNPFLTFQHIRMWQAMHFRYFLQNLPYAFQHGQRPTNHDDAIASKQIHDLLRLFHHQILDISGRFILGELQEVAIFAKIRTV